MNELEENYQDEVENNKILMDKLVNAKKAVRSKDEIIEELKTEIAMLNCELSVRDEELETYKEIYKQQLKTALDLAEYHG